MNSLMSRQQRSRFPLLLSPQLHGPPSSQRALSDSGRAGAGSPNPVAASLPPSPRQHQKGLARLHSHILLSCPQGPTAAYTRGKANSLGLALGGSQTRRQEPPPGGWAPPWPQGLLAVCPPEVSTACSGMKEPSRASGRGGLSQPFWGCCLGSHPAPEPCGDC